jgi:hypothetical protein
MNPAQVQQTKTMKTKSIILNLLTLAAVTLFTGCGSTAGYKQADKTGEGIAEFREEILSGQKAIDTTLKALNDVAASASTDPRKAYEQYSKAVGDLESTANTIRKRAQDMREQGQAYFKQWEKQMAEVQNLEIRGLAEQRRAKLQATFEEIRKFTEPLKAQFEPWMSDLKDLQKYLGNDLTIAGVDAAKSLFVKTQHGGLDVQKSMERLVAELNTVAATLTPAKAKQ